MVSQPERLHYANELIKGLLFLLFLSVLWPMFALGQSNDKQQIFFEALSSIEKSDYESLANLLERNPDIVNYSPNDCSLLCEATSLFRDPPESDPTPEVDEIAIQILLDKGALPARSPEATFTLLATVNDLFGEIAEFPIESGTCSPRRDSVFPVINSFIETGTELSLSQPTTSDSEFTTAFFYAYQLCPSPFVCGAEYENVDEKIKNELTNSLKCGERAMLKRRGEESVLSNHCLVNMIED